jgi:hypothetical protein
VCVAARYRRSDTSWPGSLTRPTCRAGTTRQSVGTRSGLERPREPARLREGAPDAEAGRIAAQTVLLWALAKHTPDQRQWRGAVALYTLMLNRWSDDDAKGVFPSQVRMGAELGCCDRQIRRYLVLLVAAGFLTVLPGKRRPRPDGTWYRSNNLYLFRFPSEEAAALGRQDTRGLPSSR